MADLRSSDPGTIGQFRILRRLGVGGMGVVYLAEGRHGRVALKVVRPELGDDPQFRIRFRREVQASFRVQGPTTVTLIDFDTEAEQPWMAVEYIDGPPLSDLVPRSGPLSPARQFALAVALADALVEIHGHGLAHRDLKPDNVLLPADGPKVIDLGIAAAADAVRLTAVGSVLGAPGWLSPEQVETGNATPASDIFSWGCSVGYAACGRLPFGEGAPHLLFYRVLNVAPDIDFGQLAPPLRSLVAAATEREPSSRPSSTKLLERLLDRADLPDQMDRAAAVRAVLRRDWQGLPLEKRRSTPTAGPAPAADGEPVTVVAPPAVRVAPVPPRSAPARPAPAERAVPPPPVSPAPAPPVSPAPTPPAVGNPVGPLLGPGPFSGPGYPVTGSPGSPPPTARSRRPLALGLVALLVVALVVGAVLLLTGGRSDASSVAAPTAVRAVPAEDAVELAWEPVASATRYRVVSDGRVLADAVSTTTYRAVVGEDTAEHRYAVVALGTGDAASPPSPAVAAAALGPWGSEAVTRTSFPRLVPTAPTQTGAGGQTCARTPPDGDTHTRGIVTCRYPNGVYLEILRYPDVAARDRREDEVRDIAGSATSWSTAEEGAGGALFLGENDDAPWRWWTFTKRPEFAMYASWPEHTEAELKDWWTDAPF